jgi:hypothetical protein
LLFLARPLARGLFFATISCRDRSGSQPPSSFDTITFSIFQFLSGLFLQYQKSRPFGDEGFDLSAAIHQEEGFSQNVCVNSSRSERGLHGTLGMCRYVKLAGMVGGERKEDSLAQALLLYWALELESGVGDPQCLYNIRPKYAS